MALVFVPTPLGNLRDVTLRALDVLRDAPLIVAEDSRVARRLLSAYELPGREIWTYHEHNAATATTAILERARAGLVAVVTDAGMPGISDPGSALVAAARAAGVAVEVLPGPSALTAAAVLSGFDVRRFTFEGFPPRTAGGRRKALRAAAARSEPSVWYEAPHRIRGTLKDLADVAPAARIFLLREYTKLHEQQIAGTASEVAAALGDPVRGEIAFVLEPSVAAQAPPPAPASGELDGEIDALLASGVSTSAAAKLLADRGRGERRHLYARVSARRRAGQGDGEA
ncbi:MAG: 16S rRNA (cytidine(1402)-2'-O)-methyltransferase [Candidatus Velthaea sp.]